MKHIYISAIFSLGLVSYLAFAGGSEYILEIYPQVTTYHKIRDVRHASIVPLQSEVSESIKMIKNEGKKLIRLNRQPGSERFALDK